MREAADDNRSSAKRLIVLFDEIEEKNLDDSFTPYESLAAYRHLTRMLSTNEQLDTLSTQLSILNC